jgi:hypothetical protein
MKKLIYLYIELTLFQQILQDGLNKITLFRYFLDK